MNPIHLFVRGYKTAVSNLGLAWIYLGTIFLLALLMVIPLVLILVAVGGGVISREPNWTLWIGLALVLCGWLTLLIVGYFYVEGGVRGIVARAHRAAPADFALQPKLGASAAFKVFTFAAFTEEVKRHGWRVTVIASLYGLVGSLLLLPCMVPLLIALPELASGEPGTTVWVMFGLFFLLFILTLIVLMALALHYQVAVTLAVLKETGWRESVKDATRLIKAKPLELLAIFGLSIAAGMCVGIVFALVSFPLAMLSVIPGVVLVVLPFRFLLMAVQWFVQGILQTTLIGAYTGYCEALPSQPAADPVPAPTPSAEPPAEPAEPAAPIAPA